MWLAMTASAHCEADFPMVIVRLTQSAVGAPLAAPSEGQGKPCPYAPVNLAGRDCAA